MSNSWLDKFSEEIIEKIFLYLAVNPRPFMLSNERVLSIYKKTFTLWFDILPDELIELILIYLGPNRRDLSFAGGNERYTSIHFKMNILLHQGKVNAESLHNHIGQVAPKSNMEIIKDIKDFIDLSFEEKDTIYDFSLHFDYKTINKSINDKKTIVEDFYLRNVQNLKYIFDYDYSLYMDRESDGTRIGFCNIDDKYIYIYIMAVVIMETVSI